MADASKIEWTDSTWNPTRGCSRISEGCGSARGGGCYAERVAARFSGEGQPYHGFAEMRRGEPRWTGRVELIPSQLVLPLRWRKPRRVFVDSMSDLFHEKLSNEDIAAVFGVMAGAQHTFQVLTKRAERMRRWFAWISRPGDPPWSRCMDAASDAIPPDPPRRFAVESVGPLQGPWPLPNVWIGVSVENQETADERIPRLLATPAAVRFVSYEPALGPVDFSRWLTPTCLACAEDGESSGVCGHTLVGPRLTWVICGGESGPNARPFDLAWARGVIAQCRAAGVRCFVKQVGARPIDGTVEHRGDSCLDGTTPMRSVHLRDRKGGDPSEWPADLRVRKWP